MKAVTQKITTAAVCTALSVIMCVMTSYLPLSFMPLYLAAFCIFLACKRAGVGYGVLCAVASVGLMFLMSGLSVKWLTFILMFAPYGVITYFVHPFTYTKVKTGVIRAAIAVVYFNVTFGAVYAIAVNVLSVGLDGLDVAAWAGMVGGYPVLALIATAVLVPLDFIFSATSAVVLKKLPAPARRAGEPKTPPRENAGAPEQKYDIFGYEINKSDSDAESGNK